MDLSSIYKFSLVGEEIPRVALSKYVYIRTNLTTTTWDAINKNKLDSIAIVPWSSSGTTPMRAGNMLQNSTYSMPEVVTAIRNMRLTFTDEDGN